MCSVSYQSLNSSAATFEKSIAAISAPFAMAVPPPLAIDTFLRQTYRAVHWRVRVSRRRLRADRLPSPQALPCTRLPPPAAATACVLPLEGREDCLEPAHLIAVGG